MKKFLHEFLTEKPLFFSFLRPKEASLYQKFKPFKNPILDVGCGDGFFAHVALGKIDVGLDVPSSEIHEAKSWKVYRRIVVYNGKKIPYPDNYFSTVLCNSTFEHILNIDEVLQEVSRVLKKNGHLLFTVPTDKWSTYLFGKLLFGKRYERYFIAKSKHFNLWNFNRWKKELASLNLYVDDYTYYLDDRLAMWFFDIAHYLSISSLITKRLFDRWVLFPQKIRFLGPSENIIWERIRRNTKKGPYLFIAARKIS